MPFLCDDGKIETVEIEGNQCIKIHISIDDIRTDTAIKNEISLINKYKGIGIVGDFISATRVEEEGIADYVLPKYKYSL